LKGAHAADGKSFRKSVLEARFQNGRGADLVLILAGINDVANWERSDNYGVTSRYRPRMIQLRLRQMCELALQGGVQPVLLTFWPDGDEMPVGGRSRRAVAEINAWILKDAAKEVPGVRVVDVALAVTGEPGQKAANPRNGLHDGGFLHLNAKGYEVLAEAVLSSGVLQPLARSPDGH